jgi:SAM-dependent methyltransferase
VTTWFGRAFSQWNDGWSHRIRSFNLLDSLISVFGRDRVIIPFYDITYWWLRSSRLTGLNYGFSPISEAVKADSSLEDPLQIELYRQVAHALGPGKLVDARVLEISCGLGGGFDHLARNFRIDFGVVLDRSLGAVRSARHRFNLRAINADARMLPLADASFDVILNIEASHNYYSNEFVSEVARVLAPDGAFVMADVRTSGAGEVEASLRRDLAKVGLELISFCDVSENVVVACELDAPRRDVFLASVPWIVRHSLRQWLGLENAPWYQELRARSATYFILVARQKRSGAAATSA